jgi:deoxycytidine triphosphate deaminase
MERDMVLNGQEIKSRKLVESASEPSFRNSSYDLRIGKMLSSEQEGDLDKFVLEPQGVVEVISTERIVLPPNVVGYAMVKTTLCNDGIFAINIGIVDPGYTGLLSSTLVNLGKKAYPLLAGQIFLRLVFHEFTPQLESTGVTMDDEKYVADKRTKVKERFASMFLDIPGTVSRLSKPIVEDLFGKWKVTLFWWLPLAAFSFAVLSFLVNWGATWSARNVLMQTATVRQEVLGEIRAADNTQRDQRIAELERQLREMVQRFEILQQQTSSTGRGVAPAPSRR